MTIRNDERATPRIPNLSNQICRYPCHIASTRFSEVQRGIWMTKDIPVVIKDLKRSTSQDDTDDVRSWAHPNILPCYGTVSRTLYPSIRSFVFPFVPEGNLKAYNQTHDIQPNVRCNLMLDIVNGLEFLHSISSYHGNLNCENVLVTHVIDTYGVLRPRALLVNFGRAQIDHAGIRTGVYPSSPDESSALDSKERDRRDEQSMLSRSDMFSWGVTVLEFVSETHLPMPMGGQARLKEKRGTVQPDVELEACKTRGLNDLLRGLAKACAARNPASRPSSTEVAQTLRMEVIPPTVPQYLQPQGEL